MAEPSDASCYTVDASKDARFYYFVELSSRDKDRELFEAEQIKTYAEELKALGWKKDEPEEDEDEDADDDSESDDSDATATTTTSTTATTGGDTSTKQVVKKKNFRPLAAKKRIKLSDYQKNQQKRFRFLIDGILRKYTLKKGDLEILFVATDLKDLIFSFFVANVFTSVLSTDFKSSKINIGPTTHLQGSGGGSIRMQDGVQHGEIALMDVTYIRGDSVGGTLGGCYFTGVISQKTVDSLNPEDYNGSAYYEYAKLKPWGVDDADKCVYFGDSEKETGYGKKRYRSQETVRFAVDLRDPKDPILAYCIKELDDTTGIFVIKLPPQESDVWYPIFCPYNGDAFVRVVFRDALHV